MMKYTDLLFLGAPLPEDVEKLKWHGDLAHAARRIDQYLEGDIPQAQRSRLEAEKEVLSRLPDAYPLNWDCLLYTSLCLFSVLGFSMGSLCHRTGDGKTDSPSQELSAMRFRIRHGVPERPK